MSEPTKRVFLLPIERARLAVKAYKVCSKENRETLLSTIAEDKRLIEELLKIIIDQEELKYDR